MKLSLKQLKALHEFGFDVMKRCTEVRGDGDNFAFICGKEGCRYIKIKNK